MTVCSSPGCLNDLDGDGFCSACGKSLGDALMPKNGHDRIPIPPIPVEEYGPAEVEAA